MPIVHGIPEALLHRVIQRESDYRADARNAGPYWGLMQILPQTARTMGFSGDPSALLDPEVNLTYAGRYLRGAWIVADGDIDEAVMLVCARLLLRGAGQVPSGGDGAKGAGDQPRLPVGSATCTYGSAYARTYACAEVASKGLSFDLSASMLKRPRAFDVKDRFRQIRLNGRQRPFAASAHRLLWAYWVKNGSYRR
jgi:hypothetical protein